MFVTVQVEVSDAAFISSVSHYNQVKQNKW